MITDKILFIIDENKQLLFDGLTFSDAPLKKSRDYYSAATIPSSFIRTHGFKILKGTSAEKLEIQAEMKMYEEAGLNSETDFKISSLIIPLENDENDYIESYASEVSLLDEKFNPIVKKNHHLDVIFPSSLSYIALYNFELLDKKNDLFLHFGDDDSYAVIFKDGQYISTRTIPTLNELSQKLGIELKELKTILNTKGVDTNLYEDSEFLQMSNIQEEFTKIIERISHAIGHKRGVFKLDNIDRIYLDFEGADIPALLNMFNDYGYEESTKEILNIFDTVENGMKHYALNALYALGSAQEKYQIPNQTIYERKPLFIKTHAGQFSMVLIASLILAGAYPIYAMLELDKLAVQKNDLQAQVTKLEKVTKKLQTTLKKERTDRDSLKREKSEIISRLDGYNRMLNTIEDFEKETSYRQKMMKDINKAMKKYSLSSKLLEFKNAKLMKIQVITKYEKRDDIAMFIKELISLGYSNAQTKKVERNENYYESFVEIGL